MAKSKKIATQSPWYENTAKKVVATIGGILMIAGIGYGLAVIVKDQQFKTEKIEMKQEFNEKLQEQINKCREEKQQYENKKVDDLEEVVKELSKYVNAKR